MSNSTALDVMRYALQQYGVTENPAGSNNVKYNTLFYGHPVRGSKFPWCASYEWACGEEPKGDNPIAKSANAADIQDLTVENKGGKYILKQTANNAKKKEALPKYRFGDSISFNFNGKSTRVHTGFIIGVVGNTIYCMEGNTSFSEKGSQSNGGCVALRERSYTTGVCVVRPKYAPHKWHVPTKPFTGSLPKLPKRGYFKYKDEGERVKKLQKALAWANGYDLQADSSFRGMTFAEVVIFQVANGLEPDGKFGKQCLDKMQSIIDDLKKKPAKKPPKLYVPTEGDQCYDLSDHQGALSVDYFKGLKKKGINCVILRSSYTKCAFFGLRVDAHFANNIKHAIKAGMHIGIYHFSSALSTTESKKEAKFCLQTIEPYMEHIDLPVAIDTEFGVKTVDGDPRFTAKVAKKLGKTKMGAIAYAFTDVIKAAGYEPMVYANLSFFNNYFPADIRKKLKIWVAQYSNKCEYKYKYYLWQYTSTNGKLDKNYFGKQDTKAKAKTNAEKIVEEAKRCAWAYGTPKDTYAYPDGKPKEAYKEDLNEAYPMSERKKWGKQPRAGASCDVFVGTVMRASGVDPSFPRGLDEVEPHMAKNKDKYKVINNPTQEEMLPGDIIYELYKGGGGHISIFLKAHRIAQAQYNGKTYPHVQKYEKQIKDSHKKFCVYRRKNNG